MQHRRAFQPDTLFIARYRSSDKARAPGHQGAPQWQKRKTAVCNVSTKS